MLYPPDHNRKRKKEIHGFPEESDLQMVVFHIIYIYIYNIYIYMYTCVYIYIYIGWYVGIFISPTLGLKLPNYEDPSAPKLEKTHRADAFHGPLGSSGPKPPLIGKTPGGS